jgi:hypothetical protein
MDAPSRQATKSPVAQAFQLFKTGAHNAGVPPSALFSTRQNHPFMRIPPRMEEVCFSRHTREIKPAMGICRTAF